MSFSPWETWQKVRLFGIICLLLSAFILRNNHSATRGPNMPRAGYASSGLDHGGSELAAQSGLFAGRKIQRAAWWMFGAGIAALVISFIMKKSWQKKEEKILDAYRQWLAPKEPTAIVRPLSEDER